jgi:hypothetical protein
MLNNLFLMKAHTHTKFKLKIKIHLWLLRNSFTALHTKVKAYSG